MSKRQIATVIVLLVALVGGIGGWLSYRARMDDTRSSGYDPRLVCADPDYLVVKRGMSPDDVKRALGPPQRSQVNPGYAKKTPAQWSTLEAQLNALHRQIAPELVSSNMKALDADPQARAQFARLMQLTDLLKSRTYQTWYYDTIPSWNGSIDIRFDDTGKVIDTRCGYL